MLCYFLDAQLFLRRYLLLQQITRNRFCRHYKKRLCAAGAYIAENKQPGNSGCNGKGGATHSLTPVVLYKVEDCYSFMLLLLEVSGRLCLGVRDDVLANYG